MKPFNLFLRENEPSAEVRSALYHIVRSVKYINFSIRASNTGLAESQNTFGEEQVAMDVLAEQIIQRELKNSGVCKTLISEEIDVPMDLKPDDGNLLVAYDPLDGSSLVDCNLAIGSIFGIWKNPDVMGKMAGEGLVASCYAVYGPRVTITVALKGKGVHEFELNEVGEFVLVQENMTIEGDTKYFAPGNLRVCLENSAYMAVVQNWIEQKKILRYSGGMVPDLHHILCKGQGIFTYPRDSKHPTGKLRLLFECAPFSFVFEEAGGVGLNQEGLRILETVVTESHQRSPIFIGSANEVNSVVKLLS